jgi:hypothetical protein
MNRPGVPLSARERIAYQRRLAARQQQGGNAMKTLGLLILVPVALAVIYALWAVLVMVAAGMVHAQWLTMMPTMGYHAALALAWIPGVIFGGSAAATQKK